MATFTQGDTPVLIVRNRPWALDMAWQDPDGDPIDITGYSLAAAVTWPEGDDRTGADIDANVVSAAAGTFTLSLDATTTASIPEGVEETTDVRLTVTDGGGATHDFRIPAQVITP